MVFNKIEIINRQLIVVYNKRFWKWQWQLVLWLMVDVNLITCVYFSLF